MENTITMNGKDITTITELRENFNISADIDLQKSGVLSNWLRKLYYESEADAVAQDCFPNWNNSARKHFCSILGVEYPLTLSDDLKAEFEKNQTKLSKYTTDTSILKNADVVATDQSQLAKLINDDEKEIVLYKGEFSIPISKAGITYYCVGEPKITNLYTSEQYRKLGITLNNIKLPTEDNKNNEGAFIAAAENNGYDFFYDKHNALANYFHHEMSKNKMVPIFWLYNYKISDDYSSKSKCIYEKNNAVKQLYNKACSFVDPKCKDGFVNHAVNHYSNSIIQRFNKIEDWLNKYCSEHNLVKQHSSLKELCTEQNWFRVFSAIIEDDIDEYKLENYKYYCDQVKVEKTDYSKDSDLLTRILAPFADGWIEYRYESLYDIQQKMQNRINDMAERFTDDAHEKYVEYVSKIEELAEEIGIRLENEGICVENLLSI